MINIIDKLLFILLKIKASVYRYYLTLKGERFYLTLFAAEDEGRTEDATERKKQRAREEEGRVINSNEINQTLVLSASVAVIAIFSGFYASVLKNFMISTINLVSTADTTLTVTNMPKLILDILFVFIQVAGIVLVVALLVGLGSNLAQTKFLFTTKKLKFNFKRIAPTWSNFKERAFFSAQNSMNLVKIIFKMIVVGVITYLTVRSRYTEILNMVNMGLRDAMSSFMNIVLEMIFKSMIFMGIVAIIDYYFQKRQYNESLKMTKHEIKEEFKEMEGDPLVKGKLQEMSRRIISRSMLKAVAEADVVITNPTHFAVALKYEAGSYAPVVTAKGADNIAFKMREIAKENKIEIVENKPLARQLYYNVDIGKYVPQELWYVVSNILAYVQRLKAKKMAS